ncbi:PEP-CTERM sorting domain-containing protein [Massilia dura]|uniref:PEP-CTERM sorting domain-containing protein n=1 Tax=Pseudoduganella dura TaxID=321982 RepID=A0A6I3XJE5_9BURK|nr:PEP-CTERM sorting domain-containing protein [Pseudoduganella dura]MUI16579.1 PEP-CTERM sorting domain-containing protein [Pseudoduganella dura]GGY02589.1 hypothetical protein GCM10007386_36880 [Pseudoduganella dura]
MQTTTRLARTLAATALLAGLAQGASAEIVTFTGDTSNAPTFTRIEEDPKSWPDGAVYPGTRYLAYDVHIQEAANPFNFATTCVFDCSMYLYTGAFDPADPTRNFFAANGNYVTPWAVAFGGPLDPGHYTIVVTGEDATQFGSFSTTISGAGAFTITPVAAVPEPSAWLMLGAGLLGLGIAVRRRAAPSTSTKGHIDAIR